MPLNVTIAINGHTIEELTIGRMEHFKGADRWHEYIVKVEGGDQYATFSHLYREGAQVCVRKALEALHRHNGGL